MRTRRLLRTRELLHEPRVGVRWRSARMASELVLIVAADSHDADRYAEALLPAGPFAFVFARDSASALAHAASMRPTLAIISLEGVEGIELCRGFRRNPKTAD